MDAGSAAVFDNNVAQDGAGIEMSVERARPVVCRWPEEGSISRPAVFLPGLGASVLHLPGPQDASR